MTFFLFLACGLADISNELIQYFAVPCASVAISLLYLRYGTTSNYPVRASYSANGGLFIVSCRVYLDTVWSELATTLRHSLIAQPVGPDLG